MQATTTRSVAVPANAASPVDQVAPTLLSLARTKDGNQQITVRLHPADLGVVQIRIERTPNGSTLVEITAEKWILCKPCNGINHGYI
jgi:flagellar hook-length control protein FliK